MSTVVEAATPIRKVGPQNTDGKRPEVDEMVDKLDKAIERFLSDPSAFRVYLRMMAARKKPLSWLNTAYTYIDAMGRVQELEECIAVEKDKERKAALQCKLDAFQTGGVVTLGYKGWQGQGRQVVAGRNKTGDILGSRAIPLLAPILVRDKEDLDESGKPKLKCIGFEVIHKTYHVQDTDGPEYETPTPKPMVDESDEQAEQSRNLCRWLSHTALEYLGVPKIMRDAKSDRLLGSAQGCMIPKAQTITRNGEKVTVEESTIIIKSTLSMAQAAKTLTHEIAHVVAEHGKVTNYHNDHTARAACEAIAEGTAFVVMSHFGYDTSGYTVPYIAGWTGDTNTVKQVLKDIGDTAKFIIEKVEGAMNPA